MLLYADYGIHTIELSMTKLKYSQVQRVNQQLAERGKLIPLRESRDGTSKSIFFPEYIPGLSIRTYQSGSHSNGLSLKINPKAVLKGEYRPLELFNPTKKNCEMLIHRIMAAFENIGLKDLNDSLITEDRLSLSQLDLTMNLHFDDETGLQELIRLFRKSKVPAHFNRTKDANYFCCSNGSVTIKAYDKVLELRDKGHCPAAYQDLSILRFEVSMKRDKFIFAFDLSRDDTVYTMLSSAYDSALELLLSYLSKLFPVMAPHCRYEYTVNAIESCDKKDKIKTRMQFLVEKTMKKKGLDEAISFCKDKFHLNDEQIKRLLEAFCELNVNPITLPNNSRINSIDPILRMYENLEKDKVLCPEIDDLYDVFLKAFRKNERELNRPRIISHEEFCKLGT